MQKYIYVSLLFLLNFQIEANAQNVVSNFQLAKEVAQEENKNILMVFSGSDWCKPCIQLKREVMSTLSFEKFSKENLVYLELDFPYQKKNKLTDVQMIHNESLAEKYNQEGSFPKILLLTPDEKEMGLVQYRKGMSTDDFIGRIKQIIE